MRHIYRSDEEIDKVLKEVDFATTERVTKFPNKTYEDGVLDMLSWLTGQCDTSPMEDDGE